MLSLVLALALGGAATSPAETSTPSPAIQALRQQAVEGLHLVSNERNTRDERLERDLSWITSYLAQARGEWQPLEVLGRCHRLSISTVLAVTTDDYHQFVGDAGVIFAAGAVSYIAQVETWLRSELDARDFGELEKDLFLELTHSEIAERQLNFEYARPPGAETCDAAQDAVLALLSARD